MALFWLLLLGPAGLLVWWLIRRSRRFVDAEADRPSP
jgi:uncharacterized Tic20 family protein